MSESTTIVSALDDAIGLVESEAGRRDERTRAHWVHVARVLQSSRDKIAALLTAEEGERGRRQYEIDAIRFHSPGHSPGHPENTTEDSK